MDILAISESRLSNNTHDYQISIPDYAFIFKDRSCIGNSWGGVFIVFYKDHLLDICQFDNNKDVFSPIERSLYG